MARVAIVTGGTRGIGEAISVALKDMGMTVAANYAGNDERAREFTDRTGITAYKWDVVGPSRRAWRASAQVEAELGPVDVLVNNAGITRDTTMKRMDHDKWQDVIDTNLGGCFNMAKAVFEGMQSARLRPDRQHRLDQRPGGPVRPGQLRRRQVGHPRLHQGAGAGRRARRRHRQRHRARLYRHRHGRRGARRKCSARSSRRFPSTGSARPRRSPAGSPSWSTRMPASSPVRLCRSTAASTCIDWAVGYAPPVKRSVTIAGHETSISLEPIFWQALEEQAAIDAPAAQCIGRADRCRAARAPDPPNLTSAIRQWLFDGPGAPTAAELNHTIVWCTDKQRSAGFLRDILGRPPARTFFHFLVVDLDNRVSLDFMQKDGHGRAAALRFPGQRRGVRRGLRAHRGTRP